MELNKLCIATILKENINFMGLPNTLKENILQFRSCCLSTCTNKISFCTIDTAIRVDHSDCLKVMLSIYKTPLMLMEECIFNKSYMLMEECIYNKSYKCILYLLSINYTWPEWTLEYVIELRFLKFCIENNCIIHPNTMDNSIKYGDLKCIQYLFSKGIQLEPYMYELCAISDDDEIMDFFIKQGLESSRHTIEECCFHGSIRCLKLSLSNSFFISENSKIKCIQRDFLEGMKLLLQSNITFSYEDLKFSIQCNAYFIFSFLLLNIFFEKNEELIDYATDKKIQFLNLLLENNWPISKNATFYCAENGFLEGLKLLHKYNAFWDINVTKIAIDMEEIECLKFAVYNNCPVNLDYCYKYVLGNETFFQYLLNFANLEV